MPEAAEELRHLMAEEALKHVPFAILGNKIDIPTACSADELRQFMGVPANYYGGYNQGTCYTSLVVLLRFFVECDVVAICCPSAD